MGDSRMIHVRVPNDILEALDDIDPNRSRADKVSEALADYVTKRRLAAAVSAGASSLTDEEREVWSSDAAVDAWIRARRAEYGRSAHERGEES